MAGTCTICKHPERKAIDTALAFESLQVVANRFNITKSSMQRHSSKCVRSALARIASKREAQGARSLLDRLENVLSLAEDAAKQSHAKGNFRTLGNLVREVRETLVRLGQVQGLWADRVSSTTIHAANVQMANIGELSLSELRSLAALDTRPRLSAAIDATDAEFIDVVGVQSTETPFPGSLGPG